MIKKIILYFLAWKILIIALTILAFFLIPQGNSQFFPDASFRLKFPPLLWVWANFDGQHYLEIAKRGYQTFEQAFFPLLPIFIYLTKRLFGLPYLLGGQLIANLSFLLALIVSTRLLVLDGKKKLFPLFILTMTLFPTSFFYQAVYNDSLFLLLATLTIYFARRNHWVLASTTSSLATLARLNGLALFIYLLGEYMLFSLKKIPDTWDLKKIFRQALGSLTFQKILTSKIFTVVLTPLTFLGYLLYIQNEFGNWRLLFSNLSIWKQEKVVFPLQVFFRYAKILILHDPSKLTYWVAVLELSFVLFYLFLLIFAFKKLRFSYWLFFTTSILIPTLTGSFAGMPRYGLHLYPLFLALTLFLESQSFLVKIIYFGTAILLFFITLGLFTRGYFIA